MRSCLSLGARVVATERTHTEELHAVKDKLRVVTLDVADEGSLVAFGATVQNEKFTHVIHNAGVFGPRVPMEKMTTPDMERVYRINTIGVLRTLQEILPMIEHGGVWAIVSSRMGSVSANNGGSYAYRASKAAVNIMAKSVAVDYGSRLAVLLTHPGYVATRMNGFQGPVSVEESVAGMMKSVQDTKADGNVRFIAWNGEDISW